MISDDLDLDDSTLKEPVAGTSRMQDLDSQQMITDDGFGDTSFGRMLFLCINIHCNWLSCSEITNGVFFSLLQNRRASCWPV